MSGILETMRPVYEATDYVLLEGRQPLTVRVPALNPGLDRLLERKGAAEVALITAWNPASRQQPPAANEAAHARLRDILDEEGLEHLSMECRPRLSGWPMEKGLAIFDLPPFDALQLAEMFMQYAIVWQGSGSAAHLLWTSLAFQDAQER
jgi:Protein of unknown function (DUF3293)